MDLSKLTRLRQVEIPKPCHENWDAMTGDEAKRHCQSCSCQVHNLEEFDADQAEALLNQPEQVCVRMQIDAQRGLKVRNGWIPQLVAASVLVSAAAVSSGQDQGPTVGKIAMPRQEEPKKTMGKPLIVKVVKGKPKPVTKSAVKPKSTNKPKSKTKKSK